MSSDPAPPQAAPAAALTLDDVLAAVDAQARAMERATGQRPDPAPWVVEARALLGRLDDLRRERDEALDELLHIRVLLASAVAEHQGQGLYDLVRGLLGECERRADEWATAVGVIAAMQDGRGPVRRVAAPE